MLIQFFNGYRAIQITYIILVKFFQEFIHFFQVVKLMSINLCVVFPYFPYCCRIDLECWETYGALDMYGEELEGISNRLTFDLLS